MTLNPSESDLLAALPNIKATGSWNLLQSQFDVVELTPAVLKHILAISKDERAAALSRALDEAGVDSVGALLTSSRDIERNASTGYSAVGPLRDVDEAFLPLIAALRDKVSVSRMCNPPGTRPSGQN